MDLLIGGKAAYPTELSYSKSIKQLGASVKATFPISDVERTVSANVGSSVQIYDGGQSRFYGMITEVTSTDTKLSIVAYDFCYQLTKSKIAIQFDGVTVSDAIKALWRYIGIRSNHTPNMSAQIESVHYAQSPADIAKKLISTEEENNGGEYYMVSDDIASVDIYALGQNKCSVSLSAIIAPTKTATLDGVKNQVSIIVSDGNGYTVTETASDGASIKQYGMTLREYINASSDASAVVGVAQNKLSQLSRVLAEGSVTISGNWALTATGQRISLNEPISGLVGEYVITSVAHKLGDNFQTTLGLREYNPAPVFKTMVGEDASTTIGSVTTSRDYS